MNSAIETGNLDQVKMLYKTAKRTEDSFIKNAVIHEHWDIVRFLIKEKFPIDPFAIKFTAEKNLNELVNFYYENSYFSGSSLNYDNLSKNFEVLKFFCERRNSEKIYKGDKIFEDMLICAIANDDRKIANYLLDSGISLKDDDNLLRDLNGIMEDLKYNSFDSYGLRDNIARGPDRTRANSYPIVKFAIFLGYYYSNHYNKEIKKIEDEIILETTNELNYCIGSDITSIIIGYLFPLYPYDMPGLV